MYVYLQGGVKGSIFELSGPFYKDNNKEQQLQVHEQQMKPLHSQAYRQCQRVHEATSLFAPTPSQTPPIVCIKLQFTIMRKTVARKMMTEGLAYRGKFSLR